ncbi:helix-turn-helix transcriptional regulator [Lactobacillus amylovorus]|uniref:helix-turn-helix transcriptional regulator n=1 Tax=Lactobacillus amylovorus TaxID=1604 RepID=UPI00232B9EA4|nr:helix-turn-helix domain-containing protein [Lactobacillus amylovorus]MDB6238253.1 helix-turn-helix domain-containing protein [Lactobacillus amylovorus]
MKQQDKLYSQNELADMLGISRGTFSKWLKKNSVSPKQIKGQRKLYSETVIEQYKKQKESSDTNVPERLTTVQLLQRELEEKQQEIAELKQQLVDNRNEFKEREARLEAKIDEKDKLIASQVQSSNQLVESSNRIADKVTVLVDQAHQLSMYDKIQDKKVESDAEPSNEKSSSDEKKDDSKAESSKSHWWQRILK